MNAALDRIAKHGRSYEDPIAAIDWQAAEAERPWLPKGLLLGPDFHSAMPDDQFIALSRAEYTRLCAAGLWLEGLLINRVTESGLLGLETEEARVMLQEIREETGHSLMFLEMIDRAGHDDRPRLAGTHLLTAIAKRLRIETAEFWAMVFIGETVTDTFAMKALKLSKPADDTICPVAEQVLNLHHREEARHIAAARQFLASRVLGMSRHRRWIFARTLYWLLNLFLEATMYPSSDSLQRAGVLDADNLVLRLRRDPWRQEVAAACAAPAVSLLTREGLISMTQLARRGA